MLSGTDTNYIEHVPDRVSPCTCLLASVTWFSHHSIWLRCRQPCSSHYLQKLYMTSKEILNTFIELNYPILIGVLSTKGKN